MAKLEPLKSGYYVWHYVPSVGASVVFIILFLAITAFHFWKIFRTKVRFTLPFAIGGLCKSLHDIGSLEWARYHVLIIILV